MFLLFNVGVLHILFSGVIIKQIQIVENMHQNNIHSQNMKSNNSHNSQNNNSSHNNSNINTPNKLSTTKLGKGSTNDLNRNSAHIV